MALSIFDLIIWDNENYLNEIFYDMVKLAKDSGANKTRIDYITQDWERCSVLNRIYKRMDELKYDKIDWARGVEDGIFSLTNYYQIPELKVFREVGCKDFLDNCPKEDYDGRLKTIKNLEEKYKD